MPPISPGPASARPLPACARARALDWLRVFGGEVLEPGVALLADPDEGIRGAAIAVAGTFDDPRVVPATITLLSDPDWWVRVAAAVRSARQAV